MLFDLAQAKEVLPNFGLFVGGLVIYCIFTFAFYKRVSQRFIFTHEKKEEHKHWGPRILYGLKYTFLAPFLLLVWASIVSLLLLLMQDDIALQTGLMISMALLATIRIVAYYSEYLAEDVAKTVPISLLALFLVDMNLIDLPSFVEKIKHVPTILDTLVMYFVVIVMLELLLRAYAAIAERD